MTNDQAHAAILRAKVNEMTDYFIMRLDPPLATPEAKASDELRFRTQVLNALYVVVDALDRLQGHAGTHIPSYQSEYSGDTVEGSQPHPTALQSHHSTGAE